MTTTTTTALSELTHGVAFVVGLLVGIWLAVYSFRTAVRALSRKDTTDDP